MLTWFLIAGTFLLTREQHRREDAPGAFSFIAAQSARSWMNPDAHCCYRMLPDGKDLPGVASA